MLLRKSKTFALTIIEIMTSLVLLGVLTSMVAIKVVGILNHHKDEEAISKLVTRLNHTIELGLLKGDLHMIKVGQLKEALQLQVGKQITTYDRLELIGNNIGFTVGDEKAFQVKARSGQVANLYCVNQCFRR